VINSTASELHLRLLWDVEVDPSHYSALQTLAQDTSYVGHSSALVRCRFLNREIGVPQLTAWNVKSAPHPGRLAELEILHQRHEGKADTNARPKPALLPKMRSAVTAETPRSLFSRDWIILAAANGDRPDLRAAAVLGRTMRDALMSAFGGSVPEWLSGHTETGAPSVEPHLAIVPLAHVGYEHSDGRLMGLALIPPRALQEGWKSAATPTLFEEGRLLARTLARLRTAGRAGSDEGNGQNVIELKLGRSGTWRLREAPDFGQATLGPDRYCAEATLWSTATPIALDRHTKLDGAARQQEAAHIIAQSCGRIGLPPPARVRVHKHTAISGAPPAWPAGGAPNWTGWARPKALAGRQLFHATLEFALPVRGPIILGAGRFFGLGLCLPISARSRA
jgi:CRISPR-associated protein Csb2